jgi:hypothetical protein
VRTNDGHGTTGPWNRGEQNHDAEMNNYAVFDDARSQQINISRETFLLDSRLQVMSHHTKGLPMELVIGYYRRRWVTMKIKVILQTQVMR